MLAVRPTRVIYIENDPALREILTKLLSELPGFEVIGTAGSATEALKLENIKDADAALIDYSLGPDSLNGLELGIALRAFNENLGILIYSQFDIKNFSKRIPASMSHGWGFATKSGSAKIDELGAALKQVASGISMIGNGDKSKSLGNADRFSAYSKLTERQRATMALAAQGYSPMAISENLGISYDLARQELSRTYRILVPDLPDGMVLSTTAILRFQSIRAELENETNAIS